VGWCRSPRPSRFMVSPARGQASCPPTFRCAEQERSRTKDRSCTPRKVGAELAPAREGGRCLVLLVFSKELNPPPHAPRSRPRAIDPVALEFRSKLHTIHQDPTRFPFEAPNGVRGPYPSTVRSSERCSRTLPEPRLELRMAFEDPTRTPFGAPNGVPGPYPNPVWSSERRSRTPLEAHLKLQRRIRPRKSHRLQL